MLRREAVERSEKKSWVKLFPLAVRSHHDALDPDTAFSPYQLVFGRERPGVGITYFVAEEWVEDSEWCEKAVLQDTEVSAVLRHHIEKDPRRHTRTKRRFGGG